MTEIKLDDIPELLKSEKLSFKQACLAVYKTVYFNPVLFELTDFDEDERSDFLLYFLQKKIPTMIKNFNPEITSFGSYVYSVLKLIKNDYIQKQIKKSNISRTYIQESILNYDEFQEQIQHSAAIVSDTHEGYIPQSEEEKNPSLVYKRFFQVAPHRLCVAESRKRKLQRGVLILALKSAWYINDEQIKKVSSFCKISSDILSSTVCTLKANLINKALLREEIENNRAKAYCLINNYELELQKQTSYENLPRFEQIEKCLKYHRKSFNTKNNFLKSGYCKIAPTNSEIAKVIGVKNTLIANVLSRFRKTPLMINEEGM